MVSRKVVAVTFTFVPVGQRIVTETRLITSTGSGLCRVQDSLFLSGPEPKLGRESGVGQVGSLSRMVMVWVSGTPKVASVGAPSVMTIPSSGSISRSSIIEIWISADKLPGRMTSGLGEMV